MPGHAYTAPSPRGSRSVGDRLPPGAAGALRAAGVCTVALALVWAMAELVPAAQVRDALLLRHFTLLGGPHVDTAANALLEVLSPLPLAVWGLALVFYALWPLAVITARFARRSRRTG